ncbi:MAG: T9SS type A sorting domain-containing protein, partial [Mariniphaga sp.]
ITSSEPSPGTFILVLDFSSLGLAQDKWASFKILKRPNSSAAWSDIASLGGTITNRCTDGVWGKFTITGLSSFSDFALGEIATVHIVTSAAESAATVGTLKYCIANATAGDFISFNLTSMGTNTIKLTSPVVIDKDLTIQGAASGIVLSGNNVTKVMEIGADSDNPQLVVRLEKLTITNGNDSGNLAGGINNYSDLTMVNCLVVDNSATGSIGSAGAIGGINSNGSLALINCTIAGNSGAANNGGIGGIYSSGTMDIYNSIIYGNTGQYKSMSSTDITEGYNNLFEETYDFLTDPEGNNNFFFQGTPELDNKFGSNPKFVGKVNNSVNPYLILGVSPCLDSGNDTYSFDDTDIRGGSFGRKLDKTTGLTGTIDIGAYEWKKGTDPNNIFTWTGGAGTSWNAIGSWDIGAVPQPEDIVTVPNMPNKPEVSSLSVATGGQLTIHANSSVTTTGTVDNNGTIIIRSDVNGTGSLITSENATGSGEALVERYMVKNQWHIISSPTGTQTINNFLSDNIDIPVIGGKTPVEYGMMDYNPANNDWNPYFTDATAGTLGIGKGYMVRVQDPVQTLRFQGIINATANVSVTTGWNCIGNPFTSAIRIIGVGGSNNFIGANANAFETSYGALYFWNQESTKYDVVTLGDLSGFNASVGQGFFMKAKAGATSVGFTPAMQVHNNEAPFKATEAPIPSIQLMVESGSKKASTDIRFVEGTTKGLDFGYDAGLFTTDKSFTLYTKLVDDNGVNFQLQCLPTNQNKDFVIPIGIDSKAGGEIVFSVKTVQLDQTCTVVLEDKLTNTFTDLSIGNYKATVSANTTGSGRFYLHTGDIVSGVEDQVLPGKLTAYANGNKEITVIGEVSEGAVATLVNGLGQVVLTKKLESGNLNIIGLPNLSSGVYLLNIKDKGTPQIIKIMIRK